MRIEVLSFGILKDLLGYERQSMELADGLSVGSLLASVRRSTSSTDQVWRSIAVAVNREYAGAATILNDGDEVALLPPVSGGSGDAEGGSHAD